MPNYNQAHALYAGVDLHPRSMFVRVLNNKGKTVFENKAQHREANHPGATKDSRRFLPTA